MLTGAAGKSVHSGSGVGQTSLVGIFGAGRNGSTLLLRLLDGSPGLWVYPLELNYFLAFGLRSLRGRVKWMVGGLLRGAPLANRLCERYRTAFLRWAASQIGEINETYVNQLLDPIGIKGDPLESMHGSIGWPAPSDIVTFLDAMRSAYDDRVPEKSPLLVFKSIEVAQLPLYQSLFPEMRFVHIVRHPHSNYESLKRTAMVLKRKPFWFQGGDILRTQLEARWIPHVRFILQNCGLDRERHYVVKYEELCERPETVVKDLCDWLRVAPPRDPALQTVLGGRRMKELPVNPSQEGVKTPARVVGNMARQFGYEEVLTDRESQWILARTYRLGRQLGYFAAVDESALPRRLGLLLKWLPPDKWEVMNSDSPFRLAAAFLVRRFYLWLKLLPFR